MSLRLAVTADLHYDVPRSRTPAEALAGEVNASDADAVLLVGDAATADGDWLERCLSLFRADRPRLFVPGNHELWARRPRREAEALLADELPSRVRAAGWHWLPGNPVRLGGVAIVGSLGWYDYAFAAEPLGLPRRFYEHKLTPAAARLLGRDDLRPDAADVPPESGDFLARWNDGRFIAGIESDEAFLDRRLSELRADLEAAGDAAVIAAVHHVPSAQLLPRVPPGPVPAEMRKYAFARAYLGSPRLGEMLLSHGGVTHVVCGHSHVPRHERLGGVELINIGSTYTRKRMAVLSVGG